MIITYDGKTIDFKQTHSLSIENSELIFHQATTDQILHLQSHLIPCMDEIANYIIHCFKRGDDKVHLSDHLDQFSTAVLVKQDQSTLSSSE
ncbi:hypothetical protein PsalMR5_03354 [Piscirickettsia salmonis]|uniref:hypothetical protein n=1 Tax=Piscirickettsia salmonis TaxID=1238 RepID=UPI0012BACF47|nr:hypothetical protein [Piscirickettsia salmonis]QGP55880.1 hypothetical protein PsalSR1_03349 [Piscirickettsia salmonis]QGP58247.1 hypothetical protein PsalBI1_00802 [Piscirickettsia salmonis]QGP65449.1 hypothetical protein PsalMR5_03354 [Piscirickettsia salmonis]